MQKTKLSNKNCIHVIFYFEPFFKCKGLKFGQSRDCRTLINLCAFCLLLLLYPSFVIYYSI